MNDVLKTIQLRRTIRRFTSDPVYGHPTHSLQGLFRVGGPVRGADKVVEPKESSAFSRRIAFPSPCLSS